MEKSKRKRIIFLALSGVCAALSVIWVYLYVWLWSEGHIPGQYDDLLIAAPVLLFAAAAALCFLLSFVPGSRNGKMRTGIWAAAGILTAYVIVVGYIPNFPPFDLGSRVYLFSVTLAPILAALGVLLGHKLRNHIALKITRGAAAALLVCAASVLGPVSALVLFGMH